MLAGGMLAGGAYSFRQQKLPLIAQIIMLILAIALVGYGMFIVANY